MGRFQRPSGRRHQISWGVVAVITLFLAAGAIVIFNLQQAGHHPLKIRRELRKF
ncbi:hypothetical protein [Synechococcus sp. EJ6-Ellesmere]|uniref:hypothetical protein n=1 Tax=Synechococcus sp. EJ6-Ellesmere TaxID=2823734 RepID=UPI0020CEC6E3|nr:hypothetical protein [Synechococcus sp. EJ6-Ellesmere]MCP9825167.1 hypothetical protein [Synechococcus sp. EJ6-Ellesmere]